MKNLAGIPAHISNPVVMDELRLAGVHVICITFTKERKPEVGSTLIGVLHFADGTLVVFSREWCYWVVRATRSLPRKQTAALNTLMGDVVRAPEVGVHGCHSWHVDTQDGLNTLTAVLKHEFGNVSEGKPPSVAELVQKYLLDDAIYGG